MENCACKVRSWLRNIPWYMLSYAFKFQLQAIKKQERKEDDGKKKEKNRWAEQIKWERKKIIDFVRTQ